VHQARKPPTQDGRIAGMIGYTTRRRIRRPLTAIRRRRWSKRVNPFTRAIYESQDYRPAVRRFFKASARDRDLLIDVDLPDGAVVLDVGAFVGDWSQRVLARADRTDRTQLEIHAFEPVPNAIQHLRRNLGDEPRVHVHEYGLGGRDRDEILVVSGPGSSIFEPANAEDVLGHARVPIRDVDRALTVLGVDDIDLAKINIEGGEFELLDRLHETGWMQRTGAVIVQFHEFAPDAYRSRRRIRRQLAETHRCTWNYPWVYERWDPR
jgi:FkbM family methyltransferase